MLLLITTLNYKTFVNFFYGESSSTLYTFFSSETFLGKKVRDLLVLKNTY